MFDIENKVLILMMMQSRSDAKEKSFDIEDVTDHLVFLGMIEDFREVFKLPVVSVLALWWNSCWRVR